MTQTPNQYPQKLSRLNFFSRWEVAELPKLLMPDEQVLGVLSGFYTAGTAILCVTSKRLLLVDKKLFRLSYEDIRFESIKEVSYSHQLLIASVKFFYAGRTMQFRSWYGPELRILAQFVQHKMFEVRQQRQQEVEAVPSTQQAPTTSQPAPAISTISETAIAANQRLEEYLTERIARWRRATRFVDTITTSKADSIQDTSQ